MERLKSIEGTNLAPSLSNVNLEELVSYYEKSLSPNAISFLKRKGIELETAEKYHIGFEGPQIGFNASQSKLSGYFINHLVFPIYNEAGHVVDLLGQPIQEVKPHNKMLLGKTDIFFNQAVIEEADEVILCRDVFDVLTLEQAEVAAICVPEYNVFKEAHAHLLKGKRVFICYPNDESSRRESKRIQGMLQGKAEEVYTPYLPEGIRNINMFFNEIKEPKPKFMRLLRQAVEETIKEPISSDAKNLVVFMEEYCQRYKHEGSGIKTGFSELDDLLLGGMRGGLYMIEGYVSSGKSMFMRQMADQIAQHEVPVVYVTWDMTAFELWARSMARFLDVSTEEVLTGQVEAEKVQQANQEYKKIANHLFTIEGKFDTSLYDIEDCVEQITKSLGTAPVVFIDHIQRVPVRDKDGRLMPGENEALVAYMLHQWSRKWDIPIVVSSLKSNGEGDRMPATVEASVDVLLVFERSKGEREHKQEEIVIRMNKNRNGSLGKLPFLFNKEKASFTPSKT